MRTITSVKSMRRSAQAYSGRNLTVGFVPTMGALHAGHGALLKRARRENDIVVLSIFVNRKQFGPNEDFRAYPRDKKNDCLFARRENVDIIYYPSEKEMYPGRYLTYVEVEELSGALCGASRPGHFRGVATVVVKLLNIVRPDTVYLGQKDAQQCLVIKQLIRDLNLPVRVRIVPTVREKDGLAMSSRNQYLNEQQRREAPVLYQALSESKRLVQNGERSAQVIKQKIAQAISQTTGKIEYITCLRAQTLEDCPVLKGKILIALAVRFGSARLIDNVSFEVS